MALNLTTTLATIRLFGTPVSVTGGFFLTIALLGFGPSSTGPTLAAWVILATVSILVHEFGHVIAMKCFGMSPSISLHSMGGHASTPELVECSWWQTVVIALAGPMAGFLVGGAVLGLVRPGDAYLLDPLLGYVAYQLIWVNLAWGALNLLPILPFDGGLILRAVLCRLFPVRGESIAHGATVVIATTATTWAVTTGHLWGAFLGGWAAFASAKTLWSRAQGARRFKDPNVLAASDLLQRNVGPARQTAAGRLAKNERDADALLVLTCADLEEGDFSEGLRKAEFLKQRAPNEAALLVALAKRRATMPTSWHKDFAAAWVECGRPDFSANKILCDPATTLAPISKEQLARVDSLTRFFLLLANEGRSSAAADAALELDVNSSPAVELLTFIVLSSRRIGAAKFALAYERRESLRRSFAASTCGNSHLALLGLLHGTDRNQRLGHRDLQALTEALDRPLYDSLFGPLLLEVRDAFSRNGIELPSERAFCVATHALEVPAWVLQSRVTATMSSGELHLREQAMNCLERAAARLEEDRTLLTRIVGSALAVQVARHRGHNDRAEALTERSKLMMELSHLNRKRGNWPIPSLRDDLIEGIGKDEVSTLATLNPTMPQTELVLRAAEEKVELRN